MTKEERLVEALRHLPMIDGIAILTTLRHVGRELKDPDKRPRLRVMFGTRVADAIEELAKEDRVNAA